MSLLDVWRVGKAVFNTLKHEAPDTVAKLPQPIRTGFELGQAIEALGQRASEIVELGRQSFRLRQRNPLIQRPDGHFAPDEAFVMSCIPEDVQERFRTAAASALPDPARQRQEMIRAFCAGYTFERFVEQFGHMPPGAAGPAGPGPAQP